MPQPSCAPSPNQEDRGIGLQMFGRPCDALYVLSQRPPGTHSAIGLLRTTRPRFALHGEQRTIVRKAAVVRIGYLPERSILTDLGDIEVKVPKVRERSGSGIKFNSGIVPPYLNAVVRSKSFCPGFT